MLEGLDQTISKQLCFHSLNVDVLHLDEPLLYGGPQLLLLLLASMKREEDERKEEEKVLSEVNADEEEGMGPLQHLAGKPGLLLVQPSGCWPSH